MRPGPRFLSPIVSLLPIFRSVTPDSLPPFHASTSLFPVLHPPTLPPRPEFRTPNVSLADTFSPTAESTFIDSLYTTNKIHSILNSNPLVSSSTTRKLVVRTVHHTRRLVSNPSYNSRRKRGYMRTLLHIRD